MTEVTSVLALTHKYNHVHKPLCQTYKVGDTFTLKELLGKENIKYRAFTEYSPHGLEMLEKQELCKDYMQGLEPC